MAYCLGFDSGTSPFEDSDEACWHELRIGARIVWTPDGRPIRDVAPRSKTPVGKYNSRKAGRFLAHRSRGHGFVGGEKLAIMRHEIDPRVSDLRTYHIRFDLVVGGRARSYVPPLLVSTVDGAIEVQHVAGRPLREDERSMMTAVANVCSEIGWRFALLKDHDVAPTDRVRDNIIAIQAERYANVQTSDLIAVVTSLHEAGGAAALGRLVACIGEHRPSRPIIKALMCHGHLTLPLDQRIDDRTIVTAAPPRPLRKSEFQP